MLTTFYSQYTTKKYLIIILVLLAIISLAISISFGSVYISPRAIIRAFHHHTTAYTIIFKLRIPRTFCAFITGGLLALAGALMQTLLRNPLADPYVLGISGGAAVATLLAMLLGCSMLLSLWAFLGSFLSMVLVVTLAQMRQNFSSLKLLLVGIVIATGWSAVISFILSISPNQDLRGMLFWLMGDLSYATFSIWQAFILVFGLIVSLCLANPLNILARGEQTAQSLGINTHRLNWILYLLASLLTAYAVSIAGCIGFIGLITPHMLRLLGNSDHRFVLPSSVLLGGSLLTIADTIARSILAPVQLPVGIVTAIIGVPCFLILLQRGYQK